MKGKSIFFRIPKTGKEGFVIQLDDGAYFYDQLHHHPEMQLTYILEGTGNLFIGDTISPFGPEDLILIGPNQSHVFKSDQEYFQGDTDKKARSVSVFFHEKSLGEGFFNISEMSAIQNLIKRSVRGIHFYPDIAQTIGLRVADLLEKSGFSRFLEILSILNDLAISDQYNYLATISNSNPPSDQESRKINDVIMFIFDNYQEEIELDQVASIANYSKAAFCRFFKQRTRKTFSEFLNEVRVSQACKLLQKTDLNISQVCYESGYNNVSYFNRQFKRIMGMSPTSYTKKYEASLSDPSENKYFKMTNSSVAQ